VLDHYRGQSNGERREMIRDRLGPRLGASMLRAD